MEAPRRRVAYYFVRSPFLVGSRGHFAKFTAFKGVVEREKITAALNKSR